jgi:hypothetical protein
MTQRHRWCGAERLATEAPATVGPSSSYRRRWRRVSTLLPRFCCGTHSIWVLNVSNQCCDAPAFSFPAMAFVDHVVYNGEVHTYLPEFLLARVATSSPKRHSSGTHDARPSLAWITLASSARLILKLVLCPCLASYRLNLQTNRTAITFSKYARLI